MAANGKTLEYLIKEGLVRVSAESTDYVVIRTFNNSRGTQSTASQTSEYAVKLSDLLGALEDSAEITAHITDTTDAHDASAVSYDPTTSGLIGTTVQEAIDEIVANPAGGTLREIVVLDSATILAGGTPNIWAPTYVDGFPLVHRAIIYYQFGTTVYSHLDGMMMSASIPLYGQNQTFGNIAIHNVPSDFVQVLTPADGVLTLAGGFSLNFGANAPTGGDGEIVIVFEYSLEPYDPTI